MLSEAFSARKVNGKVARGRIKAGYGVFAVPTVGTAGTSMLDPGEVFQIADPGIDADVDAIITAITSSVGVQTFSGATLNGVVGALEMQPARLVTLVLSNHADWDATNATLIGVDHNGLTATETLAIPNGGNATVTSTTRFMSVTSLAIPAQSGVGGTATVGVAALTATMTITAFRGVAIRQPIKTTIASGGLYGFPGITSTTVTADYVDAETVPCMTAGGIWVYGEEALTEGDPVYVRVAAGTATALGGFRNDADTATCVLIPGAKVERDSTGAGPALVSFPHYFGA
jgi:hypothetical protein